MTLFETFITFFALACPKDLESETQTIQMYYVETQII